MSDLDHSNTFHGEIQPPGPADIGALVEEALNIAHNGNGNGPGQAPPAPRRFTPIPADDLDKLPPLDWWRKGEIPKVGFGGVFGPTASGKSFYMLDAGAEIAQTAPVVYVAAEGAAGYAARKLVWCKHHGKGPGQLFFVAEAVNLLEPGDVQAFIDAITSLSPALIIFDTLARCMLGGDENSAQSMGVAIASCDYIRHKTGATVFVVHHSGKSGNVVERGSSALRAAADVWLSLSNDDGLITLTAEKVKDGTSFEPRALRLLTIETGRTMADGAPETSCVVVPSDRVIMKGVITKNGWEILKALALETFKDTGGRASVLIDVTGLKPATFYRTASALVRDGYARQHEKGDPYYLTAMGDIELSKLS